MIGAIQKPMRLSVYREKSHTTACLCKAMCEASLKFLPIHFDSTGKDDDGREYRYASLAAIKKATSRALWEAGVWVHGEYGFDEQRGRYICVTVEKDDEWVASYLDIPQATTLRKRKGMMTQLRRIAIEGLLDLAAEQDSDADAPDDDASEVAGDPLELLNAAKGWESMMQLATDAIKAAANAKTVEAKLSKAREKAQAGELNPKDLPVLEKLAAKRIKDLEAAAEKAGVKPEAAGATT